MGAAAPGGPILNEAVLDGLLELGGAAFTAEVIACFRRDTPARLELAQGAVARGDFAEVRRAVHALYGGAGQLGAEGFAEAAQAAEAAALRGEATAVHEHVASLTRLGPQVMLALENWSRGRLGAAPAP